MNQRNQEHDLDARDSRSEAELIAALEAMGADVAEGVLSQLASALFPAGAADPAQLTWTDKPPSQATADPEAADGSAALLHAAELRYRTLVEQIPAVTFMAVLGEGENEIYVSPHIEALLGFTQKEWLEDPFLWYWQLHTEDRALWVQEFARGCRTGGPFRAECRFFSKDGRIVWVRGEARLVRDELGRPLFLQGVAFDITDSKRAEELVLRDAVRTTELRYRDLVEQLGAAFWEAEIDQPGFMFVSGGAEVILGYPPRRWLADPDFWLSRVHPDDVERVRSAWAAARQLPAGTTEFEFRAFTADNTLVWLQQKVHVHRSDRGERRLLGVVLDITEQKKAEEILRRNEARLQSEADVRRTLHRIGSALARELDLERIVQLATDEATTLTAAQFGAFFYNVVDQRGESYTLYALSGASREAFAKFPMPRNTEIFGPTFNGDGPVRLDDVTKDRRFGKNAPYHGMPKGHLPVRSYLAVPVMSLTHGVLGGMFFGHAEAGVFSEMHEQLAMGIAGWTAVAIDNSRLYAAAESARHAAESANRAKDEFLATMSHELRTPLNAVLGWATMLRLNGDNEEVRRRATETIERNARAQAALIEDLLDVSRIVTGKLQLQTGAVELTAVIDAALDSIRLASEAKHLDVRRSLDRAASVVLGDTARLQQVITNLLTNAVKFTAPGGWIEVRLERDGDMAKLIVQDNGKGISAAFLPHVFERFRQADGTSTRTVGGLGIGLAIVRHLVDLHGGTVYADSSGVGKGATFTVCLPLLLGEGAIASPSAATSSSTSDPAALMGLHVLVVDDDADSRELMTQLLKRAGAAAAVAGSAAEALAAIDRNVPDVLLSDIGMPVQDGYELLRLVRERGGAAAALPAIAVTAYAGVQDRAHALAAGFDDHLPKPVMAEALIAAIARVASQRE